MKWCSTPLPPAIIDNASASRATAKGLQVGTYVFQVLVTDNQGATAKATISVLVKPKPYIIRVETIWTSSGNQVIIHYSDGTIMTQQ